jgi:hypothetical protein
MPERVSLGSPQVNHVGREVSQGAIPAAVSADSQGCARRDARPDASREPQPAISAKPERPLGKREQIETDAWAGKLPEPPDFSAETHKRFRKKLAVVVDLPNAADLKGLRAFEINPVSSSPKAIARYRDLCIIALEAQSVR